MDLSKRGSNLYTSESENVRKEKKDKAWVQYGNKLREKNRGLSYIWKNKRK